MILYLFQIETSLNQLSEHKITARLPSLKVRKKGRRGNPARSICTDKETKYAYPFRRNRQIEEEREQNNRIEEEMARYPCQVDVVFVLCVSGAICQFQWILFQLPLSVNDANSDVFKVRSCLYEQKSDCRVHPVDEEVIQRTDSMFPIQQSRSWGSSAHLPLVTGEHPLLQQLYVALLFLCTVFLSVPHSSLQPSPCMCTMSGCVANKSQVQ